MKEIITGVTNEQLKNELEKEGISLYSKRQHVRVVYKGEAQFEEWGDNPGQYFFGGGSIEYAEKNVVVPYYDFK